MLLASRRLLLHRCTAPAPPKGGGAGGAECPVLCGARPVQMTNVLKSLSLNDYQTFTPVGKASPVQSGANPVQLCRRATGAVIRVTKTGIPAAELDGQKLHNTGQ